MLEYSDGHQALYIHIPFCKTKCVYCDFCSFAGASHLFDKYVECLKKEMDTWSPLVADKRFSTLFIGGGTPSILGGKTVADILQYAKSKFNLLPSAEITVEANPDSFNEDFAGRVSRAGVNRVSLGLQSASDRLLKNLGRPHDYNDFCRAYKRAQNYFDNVNVDFMLGIEGQTLADVEQTLTLLTDKNPQHLSGYGLILEKGTPLYRRVKNGIAKLPDVDETADMYDFAVEFLAQRGYQRYEVSNFSKPGYECRHNLKYWDRSQYLGLGLSAHGFIDGRRYSNLKTFDKYCSKIQSNQLPISSRRKVSQKDACLEYVFLNLRKTEGFDVEHFRQNTGKDFFEVYATQFDQLTKKNLLAQENGRIYIPSRYFYVMNDILSEFVL